MKLLILGSFGMLGRVLVVEGKKRGFDVVALDKVGGDISLDICDEDKLISTIINVKPDIIINTVAIVDHIVCEKNPSLAYLVNARPLSFLSSISNKLGIYLIQISTDYYYAGKGKCKHNEYEPVSLLVDEYARTKYAAEIFTLISSCSLVVRTNIVGFRCDDKRPTFLEYVLNSINHKKEVTLFYDLYTSSIDIYQFSIAIFDLINLRPKGILNLASTDVSSKKEFFELLALKLGYDSIYFKYCSVVSYKELQRAEGLGLDVSRAEKLLGRKLPNLEMVVDEIINKYIELKNYNLL
jgi:dTDP-4-dehydrorhamnose reductase